MCGSILWLFHSFIDAKKSLTRNSRQSTAAGLHLPHFAKAMWGRPESTALGSDKGLDDLLNTPARIVSPGICAPSLRAPVKIAG